MASNRKGFSDNQNLVLFNEVNGVCPLCTTSLMYDKSGRKYKKYELAHIYPLNPTAEEVDLLVSEERLADDVNDIRNIIALCEPCHTQFDKPRTVSEYRNLVALKKKAISQNTESALWFNYKIESEISAVIDSIKFANELDDPANLELVAKPLSKKFNDSISKITQRRIRSNVDLYFSYIGDRFRALERQSPGAADLIGLQVRTYYTKQLSLGKGQQEIYKNIVSWLQVHADEDHDDAVDIVASFFVQNCEIF